MDRASPIRGEYARANFGESFAFFAANKRGHPAEINKETRKAGENFLRGFSVQLLSSGS
jgi:hypothetical protein